MTREDIIRMARESADQSPREDWNTNAWVFGEEMLEFFAALVAAAERERCVLILERLHERSGGQHNQYLYAAKVLKGEV